MAEDTGDKTEAPTPKRRQQAIDQGRIPRSQDLVAAAVVVGSLLLLNSFGPGLIGALRAMVTEMLSGESLSNFDGISALESLLRALGMAGRGMLPLLIGAMLIAVATNFLQVGLRFNTQRLQPNLAALNPFKGVANVFGGKNKVAKLISMAKFLLIGFIAFTAVRNRLDEIVTVQALDHLQVFTLGASVIFSVGLRIGVAMLILSLLEYFYQRWKIERELKMTKQEVKDEMRSMEGDPKIKMRRRQIAMQIATNKLRKEVPTADVIVTNPTHFAVALKYDAGTMNAPKVVAKGQDHLAMRIREIAVAHGIPILERKPLARALYRLVEVGQEVPEQFYAAIAEILAYVYELTGKKKSKQEV